MSDKLPPYTAVQLSQQQYQPYPENYAPDPYNSQIPMGRPMNPYQNPPQYPYADPLMINPQIPHQIVVIETAGFKTVPTLRRPEALFCPTCQKTTVSRVNYQVGGGAWIIGLLLFCFGCYLCCLLPCCIQECLDCVHDCSHCGRPLGRVNFLME